MPYEQLTKARLKAALRRLSDLATAEGIVLELALYGGAVFTLVYGSRETTGAAQVSGARARDDA